MNVKQCIFCGKEFTSRDKRSVVCKNPACQRANNRLKYKNKTVSCICIMCGKSYQARGKQSKELCPECVRKGGYDFNYIYEQQLVCRQCGKIIDTIKKNKTRDPLYINPCCTCIECKRKNRENSSKRMKLNNPMSKNVFETMDDYEKYQEKQAEAKEENRIRASVRMKEANPMFNEEVKNKVRETLKRKWASGEIVVDRTKCSNYKGDRGIKRYLRIELKQWRINALKNANYECEICGKRNVFLHVHHLIPFTDIVETICEKHNFDLRTMKYKSEEYEILKNEVLEYHMNNDIALVVCEDCHDKIDPHYHKSNNINTEGIRRYNAGK